MIHNLFNILNNPKTVPIFFDLDDTLINHTQASYLAAMAVYDNYKAEINSPLEPFIEALNKHHKIRFEQYLRGELTFEEQRRARFRDVFGINPSNDQVEEVISLWMNTYCNNWQLFPDVAPCLYRLTNLSAYLPLGIISNADRQQQMDKLTKTGIIDYFKVIVCSGDYNFSKPDERIFQEACKQMGCKLEEAIYIGDNLEKDAQASIKAGMRGIWLNRKNENKPEDVEVIKNLEELFT